MVNLKRTREDILSSVMELIHHKGFQATGLKDLFAASGTSSGSFYNYFQSKDELAHALIEYKWSQIQTTVLEPAQSLPDTIAGAFWLIDQLEAKHLSEPSCAGCFLGNLIVDLVEHDDSFRAHLSQVFDAWQQAIAQLLHAGRSQLNPGTNPDVLAERLLTQIQGVLLLSRLHNQPERMERGFEGVRESLRAALTPATAATYLASSKDSIAH